MIVNFLKIAIRNFRGSPLFFFVNVLGLSIGMSVMLLLMLYVKHELSFDNFHSNESRLYRITTTVTNKNNVILTNGASGQVQGPAFKQEIPEIKDYVRIWNVGGFNIASEQKAFNLTGIFADSSLFRVLSFPALYGNTYAALNDPYSIVITESTALKYFGRKNVVGKILRIDEQKGLEALTITAVIKDLPTNSSIQFEAALSFQFLEKFFKDKDWFNSYLTTFVLLSPGASPQSAAKKFASVMERRAGTHLADLEKDKGIKKIDFSLQPIGDIHFRASENGNDGDIYYSNRYSNILFLSAIAIFILVMACINFVNLTIAHSLRRTKEIGIRKINGGSRLQIMAQFMTEALLFCVISFVVATVFVVIVLPVFNSLTGRELIIDKAQIAEMALLGISLLLLNTFMAGIYPAWILSKFNAVVVLYNKSKFRSTGWLGKSLVVLQFTIATVLIGITMVFYLQMRYISRRELGYDPSSIIVLQLPPQRNPDALVKVLRQKLSFEPSITQVAASSYWGLANKVIVSSGVLEVTTYRADENYIPALKIPILEGRNFTTEFASDSLKSIIVNQSFVKAAGWTRAIGQSVRLPGEWEGEVQMNVIGVVKDYHHESLKRAVIPQVFVMRHYDKLVIKVQPGTIAHMIGVLEKVYKDNVVNSPFQFALLTDTIEKQYQADRQWQRIVTYAAVVALFICSLGLFGLAGISSGQRVKEIGVRKILGATIAGIVGLLSKDFLKPVFIACCIATPLSWLITQRWLMNFAYQVELRWWVFPGTCVFAVGIAFVVVGIQTLRTAMGNPAKALRSE